MHKPIDIEELCLRWHQATVKNYLMTWRAMSYWLAAESLTAEMDGHPESATDMRLLSDIAMQIVQDLTPSMELAAA